MINVQIELTASPVLLDALVKLATAFSRPVAATLEANEEVREEVKPTRTKKTQTVEKTEKAPEVTAPATETVAPTTETVAPPATEEKTESSAKGKTVSIEELRVIVRDKAQAGKREEIKAVLTAMDASSVTTLKEEQYADFLTKVEAL